MNTSVDGIIVNNCQYAPIYLIQDPSNTQANTYVLTSSNVGQTKPISNNLKTFYENSGNIENGLVNADLRPTVSKKKDSVLIGNNLKLASFLLPKNDNACKQYFVENNNVKVDMNSSPSTALPMNIVPKIDMDRKIVKLKEIPIIHKTRTDQFLPKIKPKENLPSPNQSKYTSVQLIKLGETYHSLNQLDKDQVKIVNQALKMFKDPDKTSPEPTYDPATNTQFIYKVVSPKDLTVVGRKKYIVKDKKPPTTTTTKIPKKIAEEKVIKQAVTFKEEAIEEPEQEPEPPTEAKVTRSGRKVKLPKQILAELKTCTMSPHKPKKKTGTIVSCFQCSAEFSSLYRLQKHYQSHPTHIPAKIHSNLFHCLLAIIKGGSEANKTNIFIQQLEQLVVKLKSLLPCVLRGPGQPCTITDDIGRLFGMTPGKYNFDVDALNCIKDKDGYCIHNPPKQSQTNNERPSTAQMPNENMLTLDTETENCARINSVAKWPTVSKRIWKLKPKAYDVTAKKMRLTSEGDTAIDLGTEELLIQSEGNGTCTAIANANDDVIKLSENRTERVDCVEDCPPANILQTDINMTELNKTRSNYVQFHSAHFDIRSSPIKPSSTVFRKFQINPSKMSNYQVQVIRPLDMVDKDEKRASTNGLHIPLSTCVSPSNNDNGHCRTTLPKTDSRLNISLQSSNDCINVPSLATTNLQKCLPTNGQICGVKMSNSDDLHATLPNSNDLHATLPNSDDLHVALQNQDNLHVTLPNSDDLHATLASSDNSLPTLPTNSVNDLGVPLSSNENSLDIALPNTDNSLHDIFKDDVDLGCKEDSNIDSDLKEWIISTSEKTQDNLQSFTKSNSLIEPEFLHVNDTVDRCMDKSGTNTIGIPSLDGTENRLMSNQGESVLNFLDNLSNDLSYPGTEIRNSGVDFQLDLFTFHNSV